MSLIKSTIKKMHDALNIANDSGDGFHANEISANVTVGIMMVLVFAAMLISLILNEIGIFTADKVVMRYAVLIASIVEIPLVAMDIIYVGNKKWLKVPLMIDFIVVCAILSATLGHNVTLTMVFPLAVSIRYFDERYTRNVAVLTVIIFAVSGIIGGFLGIINLNMLRFNDNISISVAAGMKLRDAISAADIDRAYYTKDLFYNEFVPRCIVFICLSITCKYVARRGMDLINMQTQNAVKTAKIETELNLASKIQTGMLHCISPAFHENENIRICAKYFPASEAHGDFYDYFYIDDNHIGIVIADVSGKGVPTALFMTIAKTVIKTQLQLGISPADALTNTNKQLCENNDAELFVTCWAGVYETTTGKITYVSAGHNPPVIIRNGEDPEFITQKGGFVLASIEGYQYKQTELTLSTGDEMILYTDGVTEASDSEHNLYGDTLMLECIKNCKWQDISDQIDCIKESVDSFVNNSEQSDDITIMTMLIS